MGAVYDNTYVFILMAGEQTVDEVDDVFFGPRVSEHQADSRSGRVPSITL